jgi:hypothetical protein
MRKAIFNLKGIINFRNSFYLLLLLIPLFFQSCREFMELRVSGDYNHQSYTGPSYPHASTNEPDLGGNIGFFTTGIEGWHNANLGLGTFNDAPLRSSQELYASNLHGPSVSYYSSEDYEKEATTMQKDKTPIGFVSHLRGMAGIEFVQKNSKDGGTKITLNYLQVPAYLLYYYQLPSAGNIFGGLGPYFAYGIGGKMKSNFNGQITETKSFDKTTGFKPFDAGLSVTAGYKIANSFSFNLTYDYGLVNIDRNAFGDKTKNRGISLNICYPLNKIIKKR